MSSSSREHFEPFGATPHCFNTAHTLLTVCSHLWASPKGPHPGEGLPAPGGLRARHGPPVSIRVAHVAHIRVSHMCCVRIRVAHAHALLEKKRNKNPFNAT